MSRGATARLFVAVDPPAGVCEQLAAWARGAAIGLGLGAPASEGRSLRLLEPEAVHLTLCFLGARPAGEIDAIASALDTCATPVGELLVGAPLWLPPRRPRTLAVAIHDRGGELARLHEAVASAIAEAIGWEPERRRFRAHVTVARMSGRARVDRRHTARIAGSSHGESHLPATPPLCFTPASVVLYRSWLARSGATYEALTTVLIPSESNSSDNPEEGAATLEGGQRSVAPPLESVGLEPSSHSGSDSSSQA